MSEYSEFLIKKLLLSTIIFPSLVTSKVLIILSPSCLVTVNPNTLILSLVILLASITLELIWPVVIKSALISPVSI